MTNIDNYKKIREVINAHDPIGLLRGGAPEGEYDNEISAINFMLSKYDSIDELTTELYQLFVDKFDKSLAGDKSRYHVIATELLHSKLPK